MLSLCGGDHHIIQSKFRYSPITRTMVCIHVYHDNSQRLMFRDFIYS